MAHHKAVSKTQWMASQKAELSHLGGRLQELLQNSREQYGRFINPYSESLNDDAEILEIGCGPSCAAQFIEVGHKTYIDPLLDDIRRAYPSELPEGEHITGMAEAIPYPNQSFDLILCLNTLSFVHNPELVLHEMKRLLKDHGSICISMTTWPKFLAQLHYIGLRTLPISNTQNRLYRYTHNAIINTLSRHFNVESQHIIARDTYFMFKQTTWMFTCKLKAPHPINHAPQ